MSILFFNPFLNLLPCFSQIRREEANALRRVAVLFSPLSSRARQKKHAFWVLPSDPKDPRQLSARRPSATWLPWDVHICALLPLPQDPVLRQALQKPSGWQRPMLSSP